MRICSRIATIDLVGTSYKKPVTTRNPVQLTIEAVYVTEPIHTYISTHNNLYIFFQLNTTQYKHHVFHKRHCFQN